MRTPDLVVLVATAAAVTIAATYLRHPPRRPTSAATLTEPTARRSAQLWTTWLAAVRFPQVMSYWYPVMGVYSTPPLPPPEEVWADAQLIFVGTDNGHLLLDFLVPDAHARNSTSVPVTLHAQQLATRQSAAHVQHALGGWISTSTFVGVELFREGDRDRVCIHERKSAVTLELLSAGSA